MNELRNHAKWSEKRSASMLNHALSTLGNWSAKHVGDQEALDIHLYRGSDLVGMAEVKTDIDPKFAAASDALLKYDAFKVELPLGYGRWSITFGNSAKIKAIQTNAFELLELVKEAGLEMVSPQDLWEDQHSELLGKFETLGITSVLHQDGGFGDYLLLLHEPWGGQVPNSCPPLQSWVDSLISAHESKQSLEILSAMNDLHQRHLVICIASKTPTEIRLYSQYHAREIPDEILALPEWLTDLWVIIPRDFQTCDIAWRYSSDGYWELFAFESFLKF